MELEMLADVVPHLENLPQHNSAQVKNNWADFVREVRKTGSVVITQRIRWKWS